MNVLVIGSGGREHALAWKIAQSPDLTKLYAAPGNAGIASLGECVPIKGDDIDQLLVFAKEKEIDLTVVGPEAPLVQGIVDRFEAEGLAIFGPSKEAARLEGSKIFAKEMMKQNGVPTAQYRVFNDAAQAKRYLIDQEPPMVIKADGLAAGKGVIIAQSCEEGIHAVNSMMSERVFGDAGSRVIVEECLRGSELSVLVLTDGEHAVPLSSSQDHKRVFDQDEGPNTGGMGAYSPCPLVDDEKLREIVDRTALPIIRGLRNAGIIYKGILYVGLMMTPEGPSVLEYNVRFGDPETQAILPRLKSDFLSLLLQVAKGALFATTLAWDSRAALTVVMASGGYPGNYETNFPISGLQETGHGADVMVFHAGTKRNERGEICTAGGRVLNVTALGETLKEAYEKAYAAVRPIYFKDVHFRTDIGARALLNKMSIS